ncbi:MAG: prohibitin family protein [Bacilli bacterium]|nr:prohibitin family protein [Bacilli bacterium]
MIKTILFVISIAAILITLGMLIMSTGKKNAGKNRSLAVVASTGLSISVLFGLLVPGSFHQVEAGTYAVVKEVGKIVDVRTPGTYFDFYMFRTYETYDATVQQVKITTSAYSKDGQTMDLEVYLQYQIQLDKLIIKDANGKIIQTEGIAGKYVTLNSLQDRIETQCIEKTKSVMSSAEAMAIIQNRATFSDLVSTTVRDAIGPDYYVNVQDVVLTNIDFTDEFEKSVEDKVVAEQQKQASITKAEAELEVAKIEAQKKIEEAKGNAEAQLIAAEAAAKAATAKIIELARTEGYEIEETTNSEGITTYKIIIPSGQEEGFKKLVLEYLEYLAYLEQWNGELPDVVAGDDAISIIVPNN